MATPRAELKVWNGAAKKSIDELGIGASNTRAAIYVWTGSTLLLAYPSTSDLSQVTGFGTTPSTSNPDSAIVAAWSLGSTAEVFDRFEVQSKTTKGVFAEIAESPVARPTVTVTDGSLADNTIYLHRVRRLYDAVGYSTEGVFGPWSAVASTQTAKTPPSTAFTWAPGYPKDDPADGDSVLLRAVGVPASTAYDVYWKLNASMAGNPVANGTLRAVVPETDMEAPSEFDLASTGAAWGHGDVIYLFARGRNSGGVGPFSTVEVATTIIEAVPGVPTIGVATWSSATFTASVAWTPNAPLTQTTFNIESNKGACGSGFEGWVNEGNDAASPAPIAVTEGHSYKFHVRALGLGGNSTFSGDSNTILVSVTPTAPTSFVATIAGSSDPTTVAKTTWVLGGGTVDEHEIEYKTTGAAWTGNPQVTGIGGGSTSTTVSSLGDDTRYDMRVRAANDCGQDGAWSAEDQVVTDPNVPAVPTWASGFPAPVQAFDDRIRLVLDPAADANNFDFNFSASSGFTPGGGNYVSTGSTDDVTHTGRTANTKYFYRARSWNVGINKNEASAYGVEAGAVTHVNVPHSLRAELLTSGCPAIAVIYNWLNTNSTGNVRSETMTVQTLTGSTVWATQSSTLAGGTTSYTDSLASTATQGFRVKFNSESNYASKTGGPEFPPECPV